MFARSLPMPANIIFVIDDSGSMDAEVLVEGQTNGMFPNPASSFSHTFFIFSDPSQPGDNLNKEASAYAGPEGRLFWRLQYFGVNRQFYNPNVTYLPWPSYPGKTFANASVATPYSDPFTEVSANRLDLNATSFTVASAGSGIAIKHAHYFLQSAQNNKPYLVTLDGTIRYYEAAIENQYGNPLYEKVIALTLVTEEAVPGDVKATRSYSEERQNFANWYQYHRRREFVAKNALAHSAPLKTPGSGSTESTNRWFRR